MSFLAGAAARCPPIVRPPPSTSGQKPLAHLDWSFLLMHMVCFSGNLCLGASLLSARQPLVHVPRGSFSSKERWRNRLLDGVNSSQGGTYDQSKRFQEGCILSWYPHLASLGVELPSAGSCVGVSGACSFRGSASRNVGFLINYHGTPLVSKEVRKETRP